MPGFFADLPPGLLRNSIFPLIRAEDVFVLLGIDKETRLFVRKDLEQMFYIDPLLPLFFARQKLLDLRALIKKGAIKINPADFFRMPPSCQNSFAVSGEEMVADGSMKKLIKLILHNKPFFNGKQVMLGDERFPEVYFSLNFFQNLAGVLKSVVCKNKNKERQKKINDMAPFFSTVDTVIKAVQSGKYLEDAERALACGGYISMSSITEFKKSFQHYALFFAISFDKNNLEILTSTHAKNEMELAAMKIAFYLNSKFFENLSRKAIRYHHAQVCEKVDLAKNYSLDDLKTTLNNIGGYSGGSIGSNVYYIIMQTLHLANLRAMMSIEEYIFRADNLEHLQKTNDRKKFEVMQKYLTEKKPPDLIEPQKVEPIVHITCEQLYKKSIGLPQNDTSSSVINPENAKIITTLEQFGITDFTSTNTQPSPTLKL